MLKRTTRILPQLRTCGFAAPFIMAAGALPGSFAHADGFLGARAAAQPEKAEPAPQVTATQAELGDTGEAATLAFAVSAPIEASAFVLAEPDRVIVELPNLIFQLDPPAAKAAKAKSRRQPAHLVASYRFGSFAPGRSRIVIDLDGPARVVRTEISKNPKADGYQLVIQLAKTDRTAFLAAAQAARTQMANAALDKPALRGTPAPLSNPAAAALPRIIIDPGHGGIDSGAQVGGLIEKYVVLDFAKLLAAKLEATGRYQVVMTRSDDSFISLGDRVKLARDEEAALFVSIHADTLAESDVTGATVYTVSDKASDSEAARVAEKENQSDAAAGVEGKDEASGVSNILFELTRRETRSYSHVFQHTLTNYWKVAARLNKNPERSAGFKVLTAPDVPSVLLELGYLSNEKDAAALNSPEWRDKATGQVANAIGNFFAARGLPLRETAEAPAPDPSNATLDAAKKPAEATNVAAASH